MKLDIISYHDLLSPTQHAATIKHLESMLQQKGIIGIRDVPDFEKKSQAYIHAARAFSRLDETIKQQYAPDREAGDTEGYELGAEWFKNEKEEWQIDDKKASFYAWIPNQAKNKWPREVDLQTPYLDLGQLIFNTGKLVLAALQLQHAGNLDADRFVGNGRMLHYHKEGNKTNASQNWCGAHYDHGILTGLMPAYYFKDGEPVEEPAEAGLYIKPTNGTDFEKINASDKSILLFQVGEFGQLASNDRIHATKHLVKKSTDGIDRYTLAIFYSANADATIHSSSVLARDTRYQKNQAADGSITYQQWDTASIDQYRAMQAGAAAKPL